MPQSNSRIFRIALLAALVAGLFALGCKKAGPPQGKGNGKGRSEAPPVPVEVSSPEFRTMHKVLRSTGNLSSRTEVDVVAEATGIVAEVKADESQQVKKGQPLLTLNRRELSLARDRAKADFDKATADLARTRQLFKEKLLSKDVLDQNVHAQTQARLALEQAQINLEHTIIKSPVDGVVVQRRVDIGDLVQDRQVVFSLVDNTNLEVPIYVPEQDAAKVFLGAPAYFSSDALPGQNLLGKVSRISPVVDPDTGTLKVTVAPDQEAMNFLRAGMFLTVKVVLDEKENTMAIPKRSLVYKDGSESVYVLEGDVAKRVKVVLGYTDEMYAEVLEGLAAEDRIVVVGQSALKPGSKVSVNGGSEENEEKTPAEEPQTPAEG